MNLVNLLLYKGTLARQPVAGTFELTARCNLSCKMCYIHNADCDGALRARELTARQWLDIADQAAAAGTLVLLLTGGEPMLRTDFSEIYRGCAERGFLITVNTNGTCITPELTELFRRHPPLRLNVSLYGMSAQTYEALCGNGEMFARVTENLRKLRSMGVSVQINFTATPLNCADIAAVKQFADEIGATLQFTAYSFPEVRTAERRKETFERFTPTQCAAASVEYMRLTHEGESLSRFCADPPPGGEDCKSLSDKVRCRAARGSYWITHRGEMLPCGMLPSVSHSVCEKGFLGAWDALVSDFSRVKMPSDCVSCENYARCEVCPAICYAENGAFDAVPTYICQKNAIYREKLRRAAEETRSAP